MVRHFACNAPQSSSLSLVKSSLTIIALSILCLEFCIVEGKHLVSGGQEAVSHQFPFYGGLTVTGLDKIICSGFFYRENIFISLANCQGNKYKETDLIVIAGSNDRTCPSDKPCATFNVEKTLTHPGYSAKTLENDIGIYLLKQNISQFDSIEQDIRISAIDIADFIPANISVIYQFMGWGRENLSSPTGAQLLQTIDQTFVDNSDCVNADSSGKFNMEKMKCIRRSNRGGCLGDGGSPLVYNDSNNSTQVAAFFSFSLGDSNKICDEGTYHAYLNLPKYKRWIDSSITSLKTSTAPYSTYFSTLLLVIVSTIILLK